MPNLDSCGITHQWTALSFLTGTVSCVMILFTIPLNIAVIVAVVKSKNYASTFYVILLNIAVSDLLVGLIIDPLGATLIIREGLRQTLTQVQIKVFTSGMFMFGTSSVLYMALLNFDRFISIQWPDRYDSITKLHCTVVFIFVWVLSLACGYISIRVGFAIYLLIFSLFNVLFTIAVMCITMRTFLRKLVTVTTAEDANLSFEPNQQNSRVATTKVFIIGRYRASSNERRIIRTLFYMLIIFISCYLPVFFAGIYLNTCKDCNCLVVHILRDVTILAILVSSVARPINFLRRLTNLRDELRCC
eukprot:gene19030-20943_t